MPVKLKCFAWLSLNQRILTRDGLQRRGISGPDQCGFCTFNLESVNHIFGGCTFFQSVWAFICNYISISISWDKQNLHENFEFIIKNSAIQLDVLIATIWVVWRMQNNVIFQSGRPDHYFTGRSAIGWVQSYGGLDQREPNMRTIIALAEQHGTVGYFDGAEQGGYCGAGMIIEINQTSYYSLKLSIGPGSNTKVELLALWGLLYFAKEKDIWLDMVLGDSKAIVEWTKGSYKLHTIQLSH